MFSRERHERQRERETELKEHGVMRSQTRRAVLITQYRSNRPFRGEGEDLVYVIGKGV